MFFYHHLIYKYKSLSKNHTLMVNMINSFIGYFQKINIGKYAKKKKVK
jgi:hypothetical protein